MFAKKKEDTYNNNAMMNSDTEQGNFRVVKEQKKSQLKKRLRSILAQAVFYAQNIHT